MCHREVNHYDPIFFLDLAKEDQDIPYLTFVKWAYINDLTLQRKKTKFMSTPSVMSLMHSEPDQSKMPINKAPTYQLGPHKVSYLPTRPS